MPPGSEVRGWVDRDGIHLVPWRTGKPSPPLTIRVINARLDDTGGLRPHDHAIPVLLTAPPADPHMAGVACGRCGHLADAHRGHPAGAGCEVVNVLGFGCLCLAFTTPAAGTESGA